MIVAKNVLPADCNWNSAWISSSTRCSRLTKSGNSRRYCRLTITQRVSLNSNCRLSCCLFPYQRDRNLESDTASLSRTTRQEWYRSVLKHDADIEEEERQRIKLSEEEVLSPILERVNSPCISNAHSTMMCSGQTFGSATRTRGFAFKS
jgi:hypothetical protein